MSRLRARTWTREERIAAFFRHPHVYASLERPPMCVLNSMRYRRPSQEEAAKIHERTVRTKGFDVRRAMRRLDPIQDAEDYGVCLQVATVQSLSRRPYRILRGAIGANKLMRCCIGMFDDWVPSDSNPNIYVRREA